MREVTVTSHLSDKLKELNKWRLIIWFIFVLSVLTVFGGYKNNSNILIVIGFFGVLSPLYFLASIDKKIDIYRHGQMGELLLRNALREILDDRYIAFWGVPRFLRRDEDIDCVVVGPSGLFVIEAKNHDGDIQYTDGGWRQVKTGRRGTRYLGGLNSKDPRAQTLGSMHDLKAFLEKKNIRIFIQAVLVFTNPGARLFIEKDPRPLKVCHAGNLKSFFEEFSETSLLPRRQKVIEDTLMSLFEPNQSPLLKNAKDNQFSC